MAGKPEGYVEVHHRIEAFYEKYPEGSLQGGWEAKTIHGENVIVYQAVAFRTPDDQRPGVGFASEPFPGKTNFTRDSEIMNCETSAWGRALAALGFKVHEGIASAQEVRAREGGEEQVGFASQKQQGFMDRLLADAGVEVGVRDIIISYFANAVPRHKISGAIDMLKEAPESTVQAMHAKAKEWASQQTDIPGDTEGL